MFGQRHSSDRHRVEGDPSMHPPVHTTTTNHHHFHPAELEHLKAKERAFDDEVQLLNDKLFQKEVPLPCALLFLADHLSRHPPLLSKALLVRAEHAIWNSQARHEAVQKGAQRLLEETRAICEGQVPAAGRGVGGETR